MTAPWLSSFFVNAPVSMSWTATLLWLVARYAFVDKSILVVAEGLGPRRFHGRVVLMVNEHTASAGEMVGAFAEENKLATIVGTRTPGRLLSGGALRSGMAIFSNCQLPLISLGTGACWRTTALIRPFQMNFHAKLCETGGTSN